jgi:glycosyltransferase involved in cell wall biosynthesis
VHVGGGGVLLKALLETPTLGDFFANLDARAAPMLTTLVGTDCHFVRASLRDRAAAEWRLFRTARDGDLVFCFHGLPPMLPVRGQVVVFKQNRIHLASDTLSMFSWKTRLRLSAERLICRMFRDRVHEYIVQTPSMKFAVEAWDGGAPVVRVMPFLAAMPESDRGGRPTPSDDGEFLYVADGEAHKNHGALVSAWILLASENRFPRLTLTLPARSHHLWQKIEADIAVHNLQIVNLGALTHQDILSRYQTARALIFPSITESFGLPLLEASAAGLPIIAGELDYVRDVCEPCQTFDPQSPRSIAAAVKRFMRVQVEPLRIRTATEFVTEITSS